MADAVGLDFGQTECRLAYYANGQPIALSQATRLSEVWLSDQIRVPTAKERAEKEVMSLQDIALDLKPRLGTTRPIQLGRRRFSSVELTTYVMRAVREHSEKHIGQPLRRAMVVVPSYANDPQRVATRIAAQAAGFTEAKLISETLAAAIAAHNASGDEGWYLVYHLGAGPFEASIIQVEGQRYTVAGVVGE